MTDYQCRDNQRVADLIFACFYSLFITLLFAYLIVNQFIKRNTFPIKERSPYVVLLALLLNLVCCLMFPLYFILGYNGAFNPNVPIFSEEYNQQVSVKDQDFILLSRTVNTNLQDAIFLAISLRTIRIGIVFETKQSGFIVRQLFDNEIFVCLIILIKYIFQVTYFFKTDQCLITSFYPFDFSQTDFHFCSDDEYFFTQYNFRLDTVQNFIFPLTAFFLRNVPKHLSMSVEMIQLSIIYYLTYFTKEILFLIGYDKYCVSFIPLDYFLMNIRNFICILLVVIVPIWTSTSRQLLLPPLISLEDNKLFLVQKDLYKNLKNFVNYQKKRFIKVSEQFSSSEDYTSLLKYKYAQIYIGLYQEINILNYYQECETEEQLLRKKKKLEHIIRKYVSRNLEAFPVDIINIHPQNLISTQINNNNAINSQNMNNSNKYQSNTISLLSENQQLQQIQMERNHHSSSYNTSVKGNEIGLFYQYSYEQINSYLEEYKKTRSFKVHVRQQVEKNEQVNQRLIEFNMVSLDD